MQRIAHIQYTVTDIVVRIVINCDLRSTLLHSILPLAQKRSRQYYQQNNASLIVALL
jgi:hypothetical protein